MANVKADLSGLEGIVKGLKDEYSVKVGIIGSKAHTQHDGESGLTNAELGVFHEFGTKKMPQRSFLYDSLVFRLSDKDTMKRYRKFLWKQFFVKNAPKEFMLKLLSEALQAIDDGFRTNGFGMWKPLTLGTERQFSKKRKKGMPLILYDTGRLKGSITGKVIKN